jgi:hypothetical protein
MEPLQFWGSDAMQVAPLPDKKMVEITWVPTGGSKYKQIIISVDQLPQVIAYLQACLQEFNKKRQEA